MNSKTARRRRPPKKLIDFSGTQKTIDIVRAGNVGLNRMRDRIDAEEESAAHEAEVERCRRDATLLPGDDPRSIAAEHRLQQLSGGSHAVWRKGRLLARALWRRFRDELFLACLIPLQLLLIAVCNVVGFLLLWWLLFGF